MEPANSDAQRMARAIKARNLGRCGCGQPLDNPNNRTNCTRCVERNRKRNREGMAEARAARAELGLCHCGAKPIAGFAQCGTCLERDRGREKNRAELLAWRRQEGICTRCGSEKARPGRSQCEACAAYAKKKKAESEKRRGLR